MHILRSRAGQFVDLANMSGWTHQNCCNDLSHIPRVDRRGASGPKRQPNRRVPGNRLRRPFREKGMLEKDRGPDIDDGQSGPLNPSPPNPLLPLLATIPPPATL